MANKIIPARDVGKVMLKSLEDAMVKNFPNITKGTDEYNQTIKEAATYCFGGLFHSKTN